MKSQRKSLKILNMSIRQKRNSSSNVVIVAVKASNEISTSALTWALTNVIHRGDCVRLLLLIPSKRLWGFPSDCKGGGFMSGTIAQQKEYITDLCKQMMWQLRDIYDAEKVTVKMKVVYESIDGVVACEAKRAQAQWVVLDKQMKKEANFCSHQLHCNVIIVNNSEPKILRLNLIEVVPFSNSLKVPNVTPTGSPERTSSTSSLDMLMSPSQINWEPKAKQHISSNSDSNAKDLREIISLNQKAPPDSPPLCSVCQNKTPSFGKPPRLFTYAELKRATDGFCEANFLAKGGYGSVHRGTLPNGQLIAVKQHRSASTQGDREFSSEVQFLSFAQHRNVVVLIGYCVEDTRRLLVYEYICNASLDSHLYGCSGYRLDWGARQKIAIGAARGLRYLHEECRVGCIVHRDMRPNNILLTHDYEPLVGDFGLARLQADRESGSRIIGTFGYLAPEYAQNGQVSEKADVYSFGVVLLELFTGRKAVDIYRPKGEQCLTEWARPLLEENGLWKHVDPCLDTWKEVEVQVMLYCASLCLQRDPHSRPRMSQVVRMLEGHIY